MYYIHRINDYPISMIVSSPLASLDQPMSQESPCLSAEMELKRNTFLIGLADRYRDLASYLGPN